MFFNRAFIHQSQAGVIIPLLAFFILLLMAFLALAIDGGFMLTSKGQQQSSASAAALAAMEAYTSAQRDVNATTEAAALIPKFAAAKSRAEQVSSLNFQLDIAQNRRTNPNENVQLEVDYSASGNKLANGRIIPGMWYTNPPSGGCANYCMAHSCNAGSCPCGGGGFSNACFQPTASNELPNAMRVELSTSSTSPIRTFFSNIFGGSEFQVSESATVTMTSRRAVFAMDISPSVYGDSHIPATAQAVNLPAFASRYPFEFFVDPTKLGTEDPCSHAPQDTAYWSTVLIDRGFYTDRAAYNALVVRMGGVVGTPLPALDAQYTCVKADNIGDDIVVAGDPIDTQYYLVHTAVPAQPYTNLLNAINLAMKRFEQRGVRGDGIGIIGFDDRLLTSRSSVAAGNIVMTSVGSPEWIKLRTATDVANVPLATRLANKFFLPRRLGGVKTTVGATDVRLGPHTDATLALQAAEDLLRYGRVLTPGVPVPASSLSEFSKSDNFIILTTDLLPNCYHGAAGANLPQALAATLRTPVVLGGWDYYNPRCSSISNDEPLGPGFSSQSWLVYTGTSYELQPKMADLANAGIKTHIIAYGSVAKPNRVVRKGRNGCMRDNEAWDLFKDAIADPTLPAGDQIRYYGFLTHWDFQWVTLGPLISLKTVAGGGSFTVLKPPCDDNLTFFPGHVMEGKLGATGVGCNSPNPPCERAINITHDQCLDGALQQKLDEICTQSTKVGGMLNYISITPKGFTKVTSNPNTYSQITPWNGQQPLLCDLYCRTMQQQVEVQINSVMDDSPFALVQ